jgi:hypothetical protein
MDKRKFLLWILFFGTLVGFNEVFTGIINMPYRSVVINSITIILLFIARLKYNKPFSSLLVIGIAILYKINNAGFYTCNTNTLLCGPTALMLLGISFELFSFLFMKNNRMNYSNSALTIVFTSLLAFGLFGILNAFILNVWKIARFTEYVTIKALLTGVASSAVSLLIFYASNSIKIKNIQFGNTSVFAMLSFIVAFFWVLGTLVSF